MIGETLDGRYEILRKMGGGGMGVVYEARHKGTGRRVAVKLITGDYAKNPSVVARFHIEAKASGAIETQHIAQVLDTGVDPASSLPYLVMEYLTGEDLAQALARSGALPPEVALRVAAQACIGLQKAHEARVVHRDIKPANLFLAKRDDGDLIVKLLDFGIAKIKVERAQQLEASGLTRTGNVLGSPLYMSPEQARGHKDIDHRTDLWSLGIVLYQMLCGRRPHEDIEALGELIIAICSEPPRPVQDFAPWVPPEIAAIVHGALLFDPAQRYQTAVEMLDAMRPLLPGGWGLSEPLFVPVSEAARQVIAPRFDVPALSGPHAVFRPSDPSVAGGGLDPTIAGAPLSSIPHPLDSMHGASTPIVGSALPATPSAFVQASMSPPSSAAVAPGAVSGEHLPDGAGKPRRSAAAILSRVALAVVASAAVAYGVVLAVGSGASGQGAPAIEGAAPAPGTGVVAPASVTLPVTASTAAPVAPAPLRTVQVVLVPKGASVEVNGAPASSQDGIVEIRGAVGSKHKVRLFSGARELLGEVEITESGPVPPKLDLGAAP